MARQVYGTSDKDAVSLAQALLEQRPIKVSYSMDDLDREDRSRLDAIRDRRDMQAFIRARSAAATITARAKADELSEKFTEWLWADPARSAELASLYNKRFNSLVLRSYDDARPRLPGLAGWFKPHPHQYAAVARIISEPAALLAHEVGAGKTAEMAMGAMELRRLGLVAKPAIVVPNHMLEQFQREFLQLYPQAKVLACGTRDLEKDRRHAFVARIATGDWDAVIMSRSVFERIPMSAAEQQRYIRAKLKAYDEWLERAAAETDNPRMVKRMESQRLSFEERLKRKLVKTRDAGISFEQTGIDYLFVDEAHGHKNLDTRSNNPSLDIDGSGRASDLEMKLDYLRRGQGKRVCTFATATPIANSMTEAQVMTRYLRPDLLNDAGLDDFDSWVSSFASTVTDVEVAPEGGLRVKERVASFRNVPELLLMWRVFADVKTADDLKLPVPELIGGKPEVVTVPPSAELKNFMLSLASRAEDVRRGTVDPKEDNMLKISSDGRAAALDLRLIGRRPPANGKIDIAADRIASIYADNKDNVYHDQDGSPEPRRGRAADRVLRARHAHGQERVRYLRVPPWPARRPRRARRPGPVHARGEERQGQGATVRRRPRREGLGAHRHHRDHGRRHQRAEASNRAAPPGLPVAARRRRPAGRPDHPAEEPEPPRPGHPLRHRGLLRRLHVADGAAQGEVHRARS